MKKKYFSLILLSYLSISNLYAKDKIEETSGEIGFSFLKSKENNSTNSSFIENNIKPDLNNSLNISNNNYVITNKGETLIETKVKDQIERISTELSKIQNDNSAKEKKINELENGLLEINKYLKYLGEKVNENREKINISSRQIEKFSIRTSPISQEFPKIKETFENSNDLDISNSEKIIKLNNKDIMNSRFNINDDEKFLIANTGVYIRNNDNIIKSMIPNGSLTVVKKDTFIKNFNGQNIIKYKVIKYFNNYTKKWIEPNEESYSYYKYFTDLN